MPGDEFDQKKDTSGEIKPARTDEESHVSVNNMIRWLLIRHTDTGIDKANFPYTHQI